MDNLLGKFNEEINRFLDECTSENTPAVCNFISTKVGREKIHILIQKKVIYEKITIGQAVVEIEREFNINSNID